MPDFYNGDIIAKVNGKDKVIDFRDRLNPATPNNYSNIHNPGGGGVDGYPSLIKVVLCDFSQGTGANSTTVEVNIDPATALLLHEVAGRCLGGITLPPQHAFSIAAANTTATATLLSGLSNGVGQAISGVVDYLNDKNAGALATKLAASMDTLRKAITKKKEVMPQSVTIPCGLSYTYSQDKVNVHRKDADGYSPVSRLVITHAPFRTKRENRNGTWVQVETGEVSTYPWYIKITNGEAKTTTDSKGATTFDSKSMKNVKEAFINVSDEDMYKALTKVTRFINVWENAMCIPVVLGGEKQRHDYLQK